MARCECSPCKLRFTSVTAFDAHLTEAGIGPHVHPSQVPELHPRDDGSWGLAPMSDEARAELRNARVSRGIAEARVALGAGDTAVAAYLLDAPVEAVARVSGGRG